MASVRQIPIGPKIAPARIPKIPAIPKLPQIRQPKITMPAPPKPLSAKLSTRQPGAITSLHSAFQPRTSTGFKGGSGAVSKASLPKASIPVTVGAAEKLA